MASPPRNPYDAAFDAAGKAVEGAMGTVPPPAHVSQAIADFDRRVSDPGAWPEWRAMIQRKGEAETARYVSTMLKWKRTWGL